jgi:glutamyl-tRNA reductase
MVLGLNHKTAHIDVRESLAFSKDEAPEAMRTLTRQYGLLESMLVSTCNRMEIYACASDDPTEDLKRFLRDRRPLAPSFDGHIYAKSGEEAIRHLCTVAAGLDSMVLGEPEVFGQVKEAYRLAVECGSAGTMLQSLVPRVFSLVKKIRHKTHIGESSTSISYIVVKLAAGLFPLFDTCNVLVVGAGEMGEFTVRNLISRGVREVLVTNRTFQRAVELAKRFNGTPVMFHEIDEYAPKADILISSIDAPRFIITHASMERIMSVREGRQFFVVDISVPRSIDPRIAEIAGVHLYNIDDLRSLAESNIEARRKEAELGRGIIESKSKELAGLLHAGTIETVFKALRNDAERMRQEALMSVLPVAGGPQAVEETTKNLVGRILDLAENRLSEFFAGRPVSGPGKHNHEQQ